MMAETKSEVYWEVIEGVVTLSDRWELLESDLQIFKHIKVQIDQLNAIIGWNMIRTGQISSLDTLQAANEVVGFLQNHSLLHFEFSFSFYPPATPPPLRLHIPVLSIIS